MAHIRLAIIGCGNPNRSDDGVGAAVINILRTFDLPAYATLYDAGTDGMGVIYSARGCSHLIIVDARAPAKDGQPGAIYEVPGEVLAIPKEQSLNLHDFRWDHALYAGQRIYGDDFPRQVKVFLIEAQSLALGLGLSPPVERAAGQVAEKIRSLSQSLDLWSAP